MSVTSFVGVGMRTPPIAATRKTRMGPGLGRFEIGRARTRNENLNNSKPPPAAKKSSSEEWGPRDDKDDSLLERMQEDLNAFQAGQSSSVANDDPHSFRVRELVDKVLIVDFFFVLVALGWLVAGLVERAGFHTSSLLDTWFPLWPWLFQPALGLLMSGVLLSAVFPKK